MFLRHLRLETFYSNLDVFEGVHLVRAEVREGVRLLADARLHFEVVFVDCEKKTQPLQELVSLIHSRWPEAVIVGDDYVFESVQRAVRVEGGQMSRWARVVFALLVWVAGG